MKQFHYIIAGAGCAGISLLVRLLQTGNFSDKKILLVDKGPKTGNDRTWCFWEKEAGLFEPVVYKSWDRLWIHGDQYTALKTIHPYRYKMIRSEDFYRHCFAIIEQYPNVTISYGEVKAIHNEDDGAALQLQDEWIRADYIFNSILFEKPVLQKGQYYLLQHFKGWTIETTEPVFNPAEATLMDFRVSQEYGTAFVYVMPFSPTSALVEYTLFTESLLEPDQYDEGLKKYISQFIGAGYTIKEEEFGVIPMTNYRFPGIEGHVVHIGTAGGQTKASSGYTFQFIQKQAAQLTEAFMNTGKPFAGNANGFAARRFQLYDSTLLRILAHRQLSGARIFTKLFKKNAITDVLQFLDNETSFWQEMKIITVLPKGVFMKAALRQLWHR